MRVRRAGKYKWTNSPAYQETDQMAAQETRTPGDQDSIKGAAQTHAILPLFWLW
jgi:hypothetical protein